MSDTPVRFVEPRTEAIVALVRSGVTGPVVMLNLVRFRAVADYSARPELAPPTPISGAEAWRRYVEEARPIVAASGGEVLLMASAGPLIIGPPEERWDAVMLVRQRSVADFISFASNTSYLRVLGHRIAAVEDARLLPMIGASFSL